jgi:hypothetical protein
MKRWKKNQMSKKINEHEISYNFLDLIEESKSTLPTEDVEKAKMIKLFQEIEHIIALTSDGNLKNLLKEKIRALKLRYNSLYKEKEVPTQELQETSAGAGGAVSGSPNSYKKVKIKRYKE